MTAILYKWSLDEWHELIDSGVLEGKPVEFLEGDIIEMSPEGVEHSYTNQSIADYLRKLLIGKAHIRDAHPITLDNSEPEPDIAIVRLPETIYRNHHPYGQDIYWLIEVRPRADVRRKRDIQASEMNSDDSPLGTRTFEVSNKTLKKDLEQKIITYARNGIPEYWVIDLKNKKLIVHAKPNQDNYLQVTEYQSGTVTPQAFSGIQIELNELLLF